MAERLETCDEVVMEDTEVRERLCLRLSVLLLLSVGVRRQLQFCEISRYPDHREDTRTGVLSTPTILSMYW